MTLVQQSGARTAVRNGVRTATKSGVRTAMKSGVKTAMKTAVSTECCISNKFPGDVGRGCGSGDRPHGEQRGSGVDNAANVRELSVSATCGGWGAERLVQCLNKE